MKRETALIVFLCVLLIIGCVLAYHLCAEIEKLTKKRQLPAEDDRTEKWLPMSQMSNICISDPTIRILNEEHITVTKRVTMGSLNGTSDTNMVTVYMRKWPVFGISDHIAVKLYGKISLGTNLVSVGIYKDGMWTKADDIEKPIDGETSICTNIVHVSSLKGGIWAEADGFLRKQLPNKE